MLGNSNGFLLGYQYTPCFCTRTFILLTIGKKKSGSADLAERSRTGQGGKIERNLLMHSIMDIVTIKQVRELDTTWQGSNSEEWNSQRCSKQGLHAISKQMVQLTNLGYSNRVFLDYLLDFLLVV